MGHKGASALSCCSPKGPVLTGAPAQPSRCYRLCVTGEAGEICSAIQGALAERSGVCSHFNSSQAQQTGDFVPSQTLILDDGNREMKAQQRELSNPSSGSDYAAFPCSNSKHTPSPSSNSSHQLRKHFKPFPLNCPSPKLSTSKEQSCSPSSHITTRHSSTAELHSSTTTTTAQPSACHLMQLLKVSSVLTGPRGLYETLCSHLKASKTVSVKPRHTDLQSSAELFSLETHPSHFQMDFLKHSDLAGCGCYRWSCPRNTRQFSNGWRKWWNLLKQQDFGEGSEVVELRQHIPLSRYYTAILRWNIPERGHPIRILSLAVLMTGIQPGREQGELQSLSRDECSPTPDLHNPPGTCL